MTLRKTILLAIHLGLLVGWSALPMAAQQESVLVRVDFLHEAANALSGGVFGADANLSVSADDPLTCEGTDFDYADARDVCTPTLSTTGFSTVSGGGRWKLATRYFSKSFMRAIGFDFSDSADGGAGCSALAALSLGGELGGDTCNCATDCFAQVDISADRVFKAGATRQTLRRFKLWNEVGGFTPKADIDHVNPLYICQDPLHADDDNWRLLQTESCDGKVDVSEAEVVRASDNAVIGRWYLPMAIRLQRVSTVDGGDGGGGGAGCTDADADGHCSIATGGDDCDDGNSRIYPGHQDSKGRWGRDGLDNDCDGTPDA